MEIYLKRIELDDAKQLWEMQVRNFQEEIVGAVRVADKKGEEKPKRISPIFVMPEHRNRGIAQAAIRAVEEIHGAHDWELETILQEEGLCHLYEKMGYERGEILAQVNDRLTLVRYRKE